MEQNEAELLHLQAKSNIKEASIAESTSVEPKLLTGLY